MDSHQGDLFENDAKRRQCTRCGTPFTPDKEYHEYCSRCFRRKQKRTPKTGESGARWVERYYSGP